MCALFVKNEKNLICLARFIYNVLRANKSIVINLDMINKILISWSQIAFIFMKNDIRDIQIDLFDYKLFTYKLFIYKSFRILTLRLPYTAFV